MCDVTEPLSKLFKGLEDIKQKISEETVSVPIEEYIKLVKQSLRSSFKHHNVWKTVKCLKTSDEGPQTSSKRMVINCSVKNSLHTLTTLTE